MGCSTFLTVMLILLLMILRLHCLQERRQSNLEPADKPTFQQPDFTGCAEESKLRLFLTISSLASVTDDDEITERRIEINWYGESPTDGDTIALYDYDPSNLKPGKALDKAAASDFPDGYYVTSVQFPRYTFTQTNLSSECLAFWAAYWERGSKLKATACLKARPSWMADNKDALADMTLGDLVLPGSHDAGSYEMYQGKKSENILTRYIYTQEENIFNQLVYGVRHLDLRIGYYPKTEEVFWINHDIFQTSNTLAEVLDDVVRFVRATTHEIVVLDFHGFPVGFEDDTDDTAHKYLIAYLVQELHDLMVPTNMGIQATLSQIWAAGRRVVVAYNSDKRRTSPAVLWKGVRQVWGDKQDGIALKNYFHGLFSVGSLPKNTLWSAQVEITPNTRFIFLHPDLGLRGLADQVNRNVTTWFRDEWWQSTTIVATDFVLGNGMVQVAIANNIKKLRCPEKS